ncbi:reverse transcriptase domain-containing protein [Tanacetum coccineum]
MLERLARHEYYCFRDRFLGYFQIPIALEDQEKTTFTCPYGTFAYKRMSFGLCNAPLNFQRCMTAIFHELIEDSMEVFMDDFSVFGSSFGHCLKNLEKTLKRCERTNLKLNWEKGHFMVNEGIVLSHKVFGSGIEDAPFKFSEECIQAFDKLKQELTRAPIMIKPDWSFPFEIMCDAKKIIQRYVARDEAAQILQKCHSGPSGGHHGIAATARKVFEARFYWPNILCDARKLGIDFMGPFPSSNGNKYILVAIDYVSKWVEAQAFPASDAQNVGDKVLLFNLRLRLFPGKLKSRWYGPFSISKDMKNGAIELYDEDGSEFIINKQRVKPYQKDALNVAKDDDITLEDEGEVT